MNQYNNRAVEQYSNRIGVTLLELLIAIALLSVIVIGFSSIDLFSRYHVLTSDRRAKVQNDVSYVLDHMSKEIVLTIGNERIYTSDTAVDVTNATGDSETSRIKFYVDADGNGQRNTTQDYWRAYRFFNRTAPIRQNEIQYCQRCNNKPCQNCAAPGWETLRSNVVDFNAIKPGGATLSDNYIEVNLTACWDADENPVVCGTSDNPSVTMRTRMKMPSVSTN